MHTNGARFSRAPARVPFDEALHAATASSGVRLLPSGFAMMPSIHLPKEKTSESPSVGAAGRARAGAKAREVRKSSVKIMSAG